MATINGAGSLQERQDVVGDSSSVGDGWTLWFGTDGGMMMLPMVGEDDDAEDATQASTESVPIATPTSSPLATSTSATLTSQTFSTPSTTSPLPSSTPSAETSSALSSAAIIPKGAIITLVILGVCAALAAVIWLLTRLCRARRRRRAHELEEGEAYYPFGSEFGFFRGGWSRPGTPSTPSLKPGRPEKGEEDGYRLEEPEQARTLSRELSEKLAATPLPKRLADGPYPTTLQLPAGLATDDPFPQPTVSNKLTIANMTPPDVSPASIPLPSEHGTPYTPYHPAELFKKTPRSPWCGSVDGFRSPAVIISSPTATSVASMPAAAPESAADSWNTFKATVSSAISNFSSQFSRPSQVHMPDSFTRGIQRSQSVLTTSSEGSIRRARAADRAQMARVISLDREMLRRAEQGTRSQEKFSAGLPSPHISTPNPFEDDMERFGSPLSDSRVPRSQRAGLGPRRMPTTSSTYSRSSLR